MLKANKPTVKDIFNLNYNYNFPRGGVLVASDDSKEFFNETEHINMIKSFNHEVPIITSFSKQENARQIFVVDYGQEKHYFVGDPSKNKNENILRLTRETASDLQDIDPEHYSEVTNLLDNAEFIGNGYQDSYG